MKMYDSEINYADINSCEGKIDLGLGLMKDLDLK